MNSFSLEFRTNTSDGLIFWHGLVNNISVVFACDCIVLVQDDRSEIDFISLGMVRGRLELR